jgi:tRNA(Ile)-lysidine synthase
MVPNLLQSVSDSIRKEELLRPGDRLGVAVSGGADSVALLRLMVELSAELGIVLSIIHFNHKLRGQDSEADEKFVKDLAHNHGLQFHCEGGDVAGDAAKKRLSLEAAARNLRYEYFLRLLRTTRMNRIATAHTLDDQAETVLLKLVRGAGTRGLAGIYPKLVAGQSSPDETRLPESEKLIVRPLLSVRRHDIELYLREIGQPWREDMSNRDLRHSRNVIRHGILPRLERNLNPSVREVLAETAEISRAEEEYWQAKLEGLLPAVAKPSHFPDAGGMLDSRILLAQPKAVQRRLIRAFAESLHFKLEFQHVERILQLAGDCPHNQSVTLPGGWKASRSSDTIDFRLSTQPPSPDYEYRLPVPGRVEVPEAGRVIEAVLVRPGIESGYNLDDALDPALLANELQVRNWRPGDRFWPGHRKSPKKIKELLQQRHVSGIDRRRVPVAVSRSEVVWMGGFPVPTALRHRDLRREAVIIRETKI